MLEKKDENTFVINSIEDLVFFAYDVRNGNTYKGKTVELGANLDFCSTKSYVDAFRKDYDKYGYEGELKTALTTGEGFKSIGIDFLGENETEIGYFSGIFNGNNKSIYNCYINKVASEDDILRIGLFGTYLYGEVQNLSLINIDYIGNNAEGISGIASKLMAGGKVSNINVTGEIKAVGEKSISGCGIICFNQGIISNCHNFANIYLELNDDTLTARLLRRRNFSKSRRIILYRE